MRQAITFTQFKLKLATKVTECTGQTKVPPENANLFSVTSTAFNGKSICNVHEIVKS